MIAQQKNHCNCPDNSPVLLKGLSTTPFQCFKCLLLIDINTMVTDMQQVPSIREWHKKYRKAGHEILLDELSSINLEGITLSQQLKEERDVYYWMFEDYKKASYKQPRTCPFCPSTMQEMKSSKVTVCPDCKVAFPIKE